MTFAKTAALTLIPMMLASAGLADSITVSAQPAGDSISIDSVSIAHDGWLVIHAMKNGKPVIPASIGHTAIKAGTTLNVVVQLDAPVAAGNMVLSMLHTDKGAMGSYEFPGPDAPVVKGGKPVVKPMKIN